MTKNDFSAKGKERSWLWLTLPISLLLVISTLSGILTPDLYQDNTPLMAAQLIGGDYASLILVLPLLLTSALLAKRGSQPALLIWIGCLCFLVYFYLVFSFHVYFNVLFPVYLALLGCSVYALIFALVQTDFAHIREQFSARTPLKITCLALAVIPILFYLMNFVDIFPAMLSGTVPQTVIEFGTPTYFAHVIDMALSLPAFIICVIYLWQHKPFGYGLAGVLLTFLVLIMLSLLSMFAVQTSHGLTVAPSDIAVIGMVALAYLTLTIWYFLNLEQQPV